MHLGINQNNLQFYLLLLMALVFPINYSIVAGFRLLDILFLILLTLFIVSNPKINKTLFLIILFSFSVYLISSLIGIIQFGNFDFSKLGFLYKYLFFLTIPWLVIYIVKNQVQLRKLSCVLLANFIFLSSWPYIYFYLLATGSIKGNFRPSFPLSNDYLYSDAHLYSAYLGFFLVAYLFYLKNYFQHNTFVTTIIMTNGLIGLLLTGSRTGIVIISLSFFFYIIYVFFQKVVNKNTSIRKHTITKILMVILFVLLLLIYFDSYIVDYLDQFKKLISRAFNFNLGDDQSSLSRIQKLSIAIKDSYSTYLVFGLGVNCSLLWYDSIIGILVAHGGILLLISFIFYYFLILNKSMRKLPLQKYKLLFLLLVFLYVMANLITEYIFISRNSFPILLMTSIVYLNLKYKYLVK